MLGARDPKETTLTCPQCGTSVADGTAICPKCDNILDTSFLDANPAGESAAPRPPPKRPAVSSPGRVPAGKPSGSRPAVRPPGASGTANPAVGRASMAGGAPRPAGAAAPKRPTQARPAASRPANPPASADSTVLKSVEEVERERPKARPAPSAASKYGTPDDDDDTNSSKPAPRGGVSRPPPAASSDVPSAPGIGRTYSGINVVAPEDALNEARDFVRHLRKSDKLAFIGAAATVLMAILPWKETAAEGEILGLMSLGFVAFLANLVAMAAIIVRVRNAMPRLHPVVPWLVQLGTIFFGLVWCLIFMKLSSDGREVPALIGNEMVAISRPAFGVYLALIAQLVGLAGTLLGLKEKPA